MTLYEILGLTCEATVSEIKQAYRRASKRAHPDKGGSADGFGRVNHAYQILADPELRRKYDESGDATMPSDARMGRAMSTACEVVTKVASEPWPQPYDVIAKSIEFAVRNQQNCLQNFRSFQKEAERLNAVAAAIVRKDKGENVLSRAVANQARVAMLNADHAREQAEHFSLVIVILEEYTFNTPKMGATMIVTSNPGFGFSFHTT